MHLKNKTIDTGTKTPYLGMKKNHGCTEPDNFIPYCIPNRYENPAPGMKTAYLGMK